MTIPGTSDIFAGFGQVLLDDGDVAFTGGGTTTPNSLFFWQNNQLDLIISEGDMLDGREISIILLGADGLSDDSVAFRAFFTDGSQGVYLGNMNVIPEPSSAIAVSGFLLGSWIGLRRRRRA